MVSTTTWIVTILLIVALLAFDLIFHVRKAHTPSIKEAATWTGIYVGIAIAFGVYTWVTTEGHQMGLEFFAGYITELSLSVDNLFVFLIIMSAFKVPRADQQKVLMFGIIFSLIARTVFIFLGAAMINAWSWMFYIFGLFLIFTAGNLLKPEGEDETDEESDEANNIVIRIAKKFIHTTDHYDGDKLFTEVDGKRAMTPMLLVMIAIGGTDLMFAFDSIPAIFGLTQNTYIVFTAVAFSLLGLRQLYFLIDGLLDRLVYLKYGLAVILGFIGVKLILHALHENHLPFINNGQPVPVIEVTTQLSLAVIVGTLIVTVLVSLFSQKGKVLTTFKNVRRHAGQYLDLDFEADPTIREQNYVRLMREEQQLKEIPAKHHDLIHHEQSLLALLDKAHRVHGDYVDAHPTLFTNQKDLPHGRFDTRPFRTEETAAADVPEPRQDPGPTA